MAGYQSRFDEHSADARRSFVAHGLAIRTIIPRMYGTDFDRLVKSLSSLLEKVDRGRVDHPEYLAHTKGTIAEQAVSLIASVPSALESGPEFFVQTTLSGLLHCEERLVRAVGNYYYKVKEVKDRQVRELQKLREEALGFYKESKDANEKLETVVSELEERINNIKAAEADAAGALKAVNNVRSQVSKLASGDARGKSLEALKRKAEAKLVTIEDVLAKGMTAKVLSEETSRALNDTKGEIDERREALDSIKVEAANVLSLSSQAGLAASYIREAKRLGIKAWVFTVVLYMTSAAAVFIAAFYILPSLERTLEDGTVIIDETAIYVTLLRTAILAPLVYVIYFTTKQVSNIDTLRMDYAEKAAASLAYSGYKDEMAVDGSLLDRLRGSLLLRFAEHPERLLRKNPPKENLLEKTRRFRASSQRNEASETAEDEPKE